jgi:hypothetical protein
VPRNSVHLDDAEAANSSRSQARIVTEMRDIYARFEKRLEQRSTVDDVAFDTVHRDQHPTV